MNIIYGLIPYSSTKLLVYYIILYTILINLNLFVNFLKEIIYHQFIS